MPFLTGPELPILQPLQPHSDGQLPLDVVAVYPMTRAQEGLWLAYSLAPHHTLYNLTMKFAFTKESKAEQQLKTVVAINTLTHRHSILRSTFHNANKYQFKPFIAEWDASVTPTLQIITKSNNTRADAKVNSLLRTAVDLSSTFAVRWLIVMSAGGTELFLVSHHIALDGGSMSHLSKELLYLLDVKKDLQPGLLNRESFSRAHMLEGAFTNSAGFEAAQAFWVRQSTNVRTIKWKGTSAVQQHPNAKNYREIEDWFSFSNAELRTWGNRYRASWFRVAVALVGVLVRSIAEPDGGADHSVTVAFGGRPAGMEDTVGQFANAVPIRIALSEVLASGPPSFEALVNLVSKEVSTAKKHDRLSYLDISNAHRKLGLQVSPAQVAITISPKLSRKECTLYPVEGPYDIFFCFLEGDDGVSLGVIYDPTVFSKSDILFLKEAFSSLHALTMAETPLDLLTLPALQTHVPRLLPKIDLESIDAISAARFHVWFENQAAQAPDLVALYSGEQDRSVTYRELNENANRKAHHLRKIGVKREEIVLLHLTRGFEMMEWIIAVLKSGAAFAVADQKHPVERTLSVISIAKPALVVDDGSGNDLSLEPFQLDEKVIDTQNLALDDMPTSNPEDITKNEDLAYVVFTSGSTGQPKGVEIEHRNLSHFVANAYTSRYVSIAPGSRVLQFATFAFDAAVLEWSQCLALGGTLCFADMPQALIGEYLADVIDTNDISVVHLTPSVLATLPTSRGLPSLRQISVGGEMVPENLIKAWRTRLQVQNAYGPTECTVVMSHHPQPRLAAAKQPLASIIGAPHRHMKFVVSNDSFTQLLSTNQIGEVCIGGPQVGRGYRGRDDLTGSRFAIHPQFGERLYRTGDRGKLLPDGSVLLVGRIDREVKVRGYRIELDDVERTICDLIPEIMAVSVQPDESGSSLCAFIAPKHIDGDSVKKSLSKRVPSYMVPSSIYCLDRLPLNTNDKVDHKTIRATMGDLISQAHSSTGRQKSFYLETPPDSESSDSESSELESPSTIRTITNIWKAILSLSALPSLSDNFFDIGGNSLAVTLLLERIRAKWPWADIKIVDLFQHVTVKSQAALVARYLPAKIYHSPKSPSEKPLPSSQHSPATPSSRTSEIAVVGMAGRFPGASNPDELFRIFLEKREALTTFPERDPASLPFKDAIYIPKRGAIPGVENFDPTEWGLKEDEARDMDPQQRLFLGVAREAFQDAGHKLSPDGYNNVGLYVGTAHNTWELVNEPIHGSDFFKTHHSVLTPCISARTAYHLNLHGPNVTLSTACSSGLVAMSIATDHLRTGKCDMSIVGGISVAFPQEGYVTAKNQLFSPSGHCRPFDHRADGTLPGDAVCALILRRLDDAIRDGDKIYSVISGVAIGSDGATEKAGCTVPGPRGQADVITRAWKDSGLSPSKLVYAELHGSGTPIGDALELEAMHIARTELKTEQVPIIVGSNKGNLGNCEAAGGLVSVIKMCKSMQHGVIPPMPSFQRKNPMINPALPFTIASTGVPLKKNAVVSVSSTGLGGVNAHCILRYPPASSQRPSDLVLDAPSTPESTEVLPSPPKTSSLPPVAALSQEKIGQIASCASQILSVDIDEGTDLRAAGLDSQGQIALMRKVGEAFPTYMLP
ncbi:hypothetical protein K443DRAFT_95740 [Laccaria amethystina LaAM-08-1]|uniref:Uncharacterized protein n=1 Tax=Laccaria amethystina LaAM-08-1 TaxID=1095629 RepID=A0A0C9XNL8_9AGAR|nr:hypothetical protein K443DRAFT_95740 [Laccaria amethystina LaAM-08-1]